MAHEYVYWNRDQTDKCYNNEGYTAHGGPRLEEWSKGGGNGPADHVCRPVIVDAMGRKRPIVCFTPVSNGESYVTTVETVIERFQPPSGTEHRYGHPVGAEEYKYSSPGKVVDEHKYGHPVGPEEYKYSSPGKVVDEHKYGYPVRMVEYKHSSPGRVVDEHKYSYPVRVEYKHSSPEKVEELKHSHPVRVEEHYRVSSPANTWGRPSSPGHDQHRPPKVEEFFTKLQTEVSQVPTRPGPLTALNWRQPRNPPKPPTATGGGYGEYKDHYSKDEYWNKPNCNAVIRTDVYDADDYYRRHDGAKEPTITNTKLTIPTNDIGAAMEILKDAAAGPSYGQHVRLAGPKYTETIDSKEAAKRYGNVGANSRPYLTAGGMVIDSKTAEEKYSGAKVR